MRGVRSPETEIEMSSTNHAQNRELQQDARAWSKFTGTKYTAALRQVSSPLTQGFLGDRVSARDLIAVLEEHPLVGADGDEPLLGENGFYADDGWQFDGQTDFVELALILDMLRMFTPTPAGESTGVHSYTLKHTAEQFLSPHCTYVSNGRLIWAAAALGLDLVEPDSQGLNLMVGISEREHHYVRRLMREGERQVRGHHYRPAGMTHLQTALSRCTAGEEPPARWVRPAPATSDAPFHDWLAEQAGRHDPVGHLATDYVAGVEDSDHDLAATPDTLLAILHDVAPSPEVYDAAVRAIDEWFGAFPSSPPIRTELIASDRREHDGFGAGAGDVEQFRYRCPCGLGEVVEEHDNIPGFREHDVWINCSKCRAEWRFASDRPARGWGLVPVSLLQAR